MGIAGQLVTVEIGDDEHRGLNMAEGEPGKPLVAFQKDHIALDLAGEGGAFQKQGGDTFDLVAAFLIKYHLFAALGQHLGKHLHRGGLTVGAGDGDDLFRQAQPGENVRAELQCDGTGEAGAFAQQLAGDHQQLTNEYGKEFHICLLRN